MQGRDVGALRRRQADSAPSLRATHRGRRSRPLCCAAGAGSAWPVSGSELFVVPVETLSRQCGPDAAACSSPAVERSGQALQSLRDPPGELALGRPGGLTDCLRAARSGRSRWSCHAVMAGEGERSAMPGTLDIAGRCAGRQRLHSAARVLGTARAGCRGHRHERVDGACPPSAAQCERQPARGGRRRQQRRRDHEGSGRGMRGSGKHVESPAAPAGRRDALNGGLEPAGAEAVKALTVVEACITASRCARSRRRRCDRVGEARREDTGSGCAIARTARKDRRRRSTTRNGGDVAAGRTKASGRMAAPPARPDITSARRRAWGGNRDGAEAVGTGDNAAGAQSVALRPVARTGERQADTENADFTVAGTARLETSRRC